MHRSHCRRGDGLPLGSAAAVEALEASEDTPVALHSAPPTGKRTGFDAITYVVGVNSHVGPVSPALSVIPERGSAEKPTH
jgi:hypothetical protein